MYGMVTEAGSAPSSVIRAQRLCGPLVVVHFLMFGGDPAHGVNDVGGIRSTVSPESMTADEPSKRRWRRRTPRLGLVPGSSPWTQAFERSDDGTAAGDALANDVFADEEDPPGCTVPRSPRATIAPDASMMPGRLSTALALRFWRSSGPPGAARCRPGACRGPTNEATVTINASVTKASNATKSSGVGVGYSRSLGMWTRATTVDPAITLASILSTCLSVISNTAPPSPIVTRSPTWMSRIRNS